MTIENELAQKTETNEKTQLQKSHPVVQKKDAVVIPLKSEKDPTIPPKEFPINKWNMPQEPHGYIRGNDNDCL